MYGFLRFETRTLRGTYPVAVLSSSDGDVCYDLESLKGRRENLIAEGFPDPALDSIIIELEKRTKALETPTDET